MQTSSLTNGPDSRRIEMRCSRSTARLLGVGGARSARFCAVFSGSNSLTANPDEQEPATAYLCISGRPRVYVRGEAGAQSMVREMSRGGSSDAGTRHANEVLGELTLRSARRGMTT